MSDSRHGRRRRAPRPEERLRRPAERLSLPADVRDGLREVDCVPPGRTAATRVAGDHLDHVAWCWALADARHAPSGRRSGARPSAASLVGQCVPPARSGPRLLWLPKGFHPDLSRVERDVVKNLLMYAAEHNRTVTAVWLKGSDGYSYDFK